MEAYGISGGRKRRVKGFIRGCIPPFAINQGNIRIPFSKQSK
jgi:hypothetical protein